MGASLSTGGEPAEEEGVTIVSSGPRAPQTQADEDLLHQLAALKHVSNVGGSFVGKGLQCTAATTATSCRRFAPSSTFSSLPPLHLQSLPLIPESLSETGSLWSRSLQRLPSSSSSECRGCGTYAAVLLGRRFDPQLPLIWPYSHACCRQAPGWRPAEADGC